VSEPDAPDTDELRSSSTPFVIANPGQPLTDEAIEAFARLLYEDTCRRYQPGTTSARGIIANWRNPPCALLSTSG
jgi:hypothetical protein